MKFIIFFLGFSQVIYSQSYDNFRDLDLFKKVNGKSSISYDGNGKPVLNPDVFTTKIDKEYKKKGIFRKKDKQNFKTVGYSDDPSKDHLIYTELKNHHDGKKDTGMISTVYQSHINEDLELDERMLSFDNSGGLLSTLVCDANSCRSYNREFCQRIENISDDKINQCKNLQKDLQAVYRNSEYIQTFKNDYSKMMEKREAFTKKLNGNIFKRSWKNVKSDDKQKVANQIKSQQERYLNPSYMKDASERLNFGDLAVDIDFCKSMNASQSTSLDLNRDSIQESKTRNK